MELVGKELVILFGTYAVLFCQGWVDSGTTEQNRTMTSAFFVDAECRTITVR